MKENRRKQQRGKEEKGTITGKGKERGDLQAGGKLFSLNLCKRPSRESCNGKEGTRPVKLDLRGGQPA